MPSETAKASLGYVTSYGAARRGGYTGTYEEWCALMAEVADHLEENIQLNEDSKAAKAAAETAELEAEAAALTAESWAKGTKGGTDVPSTDPAYHDNAKYYAGAAEGQKDLAEQAASAAAGSAETAEGHSTDAEAWAAGTRGGEDVESGDDAYHNNAKYYSEQSSGFADDAAGSASDAEAWAKGTKNGTDVPSTDPTYHNNAKYWSEQAEETAEDIEASSAQIAQNASDIGDLKTQLGELNTVIFGGDITVITDYVQGTKRLDGSINPMSTRCSTANLYPLVAGDKISISDVDSGLKAAIVGTDGTNFITASGWQTGNFTYTVTASTEARYFVSVAKVDDTQNLSPSDIITLKVTIGDTSDNAIDQINSGIEKINSALMNGGTVESEFIQGTRRGNGTANVVPNRCCTKNAYQLVAGNVVIISKLGSGLKASINGYANGNFVHIDSAWRTEEGSAYTVTSDTEGTYFVSIAKIDDTANIVPSDVINTEIVIGTYNYLNKLSASSGAENNLRSRFSGKKVSIIGDSIDTFNQAGYKIDGYAMYYPQVGVDNVNATWWMQVINNSGAKLEVNASASGSRVTNTLDDATRPDFYDRVALVGNPDIIFVTLGTNDSYHGVTLGEYDYDTPYEQLSEATFRPAYIKGIKALKALYPNADIVCVAEWMTEPFKNSIVDICNTLSCEFIDASDYKEESGVHPGVKGMMQIASSILFPTDKTLTQNHMAADAEKVGSEFGVVNGEINNIKESLYSSDENRAFLQGKRVGNSSISVVSDRCTTQDVFELNEGDTISVSSVDNGLKYGIAGSDGSAFIHDFGWKTANFTYTIPTGGEGIYFVNVAKSDGTSSISPSDILTLKVVAKHPTDFGNIEKDVDIIKNSIDSNVRVAAHRGYSEVAPENTLPAFEIAAEYGFKYVEMDVRFTSDGIPVLLHLPTINTTARNSDGTSISETIYINQITYAQALNYDFGIWKGSKFAGTKIPTLAQALYCCKVYNLYAYLDLKQDTVSGTLTPEWNASQVESVISVIRQNGMEKNVSFACENDSVLNSFVSEWDTVEVGFRSTTGTLQQGIEKAKALQTGKNRVFMIFPYDTSASDLIEVANNGFQVDMYGFDGSSSSSRLRSVSCQAYDLLITDNLLPSTVSNILKEKYREAVS